MRGGARLLAAVGWLASGWACSAPDPRIAATHVETDVASDSVLPTGRPRSRIVIDTLARGLDVPWGIAFAPDGRIFITERPGRIRVIRDGVLEEAPWATLNVFAEHGSIGPESGLLGVAVAPDFSSSRQLFVLATVWRSPGDRDRARLTRLWRRVAGFFSPVARLQVKNQVVRFTEREGRGVDATVIIDDLVASHYHAGGALAFGPDGKLYLSLGDATVPSLAADPGALAGKVLRFERDGGVPADNPVTGSPVWARGLRNTQAFTWLPDGTMLGVEHGPSGMPQEGGRAGRDELNELVGGRDYGWPRVTGWGGTGASAAPLWVWSDGIAPAGIAALPAESARASATVLVGALRGRRVERLELARDPDGRWHVVTLDALFDSAWGRVRAIVAAPDGSVLLSTSNRDARGIAGPDDDLVLRLRRVP